jgi:hypothetical protein
VSDFEDLGGLIADELRLPIRGRTYVVPSPSAADGLRVQRITTLAARVIAGGEAVDTQLLDDEQEIDLYRLALGPAYEQLLADEVPWTALRHAALTAVTWIATDEATALAYWRGEVAAGPLGGLARSSSAAGRSIPRPGSTSGTSTRPATGQRRKGKKR